MSKGTKARHAAASAAGMLSISAVRPEKPKRISSKPRKAAIEDFLDSVKIDEAARDQLREAVVKWREYFAAVEAAEAPAAIQYRERVNQSLTHLSIQDRMAKQSDNLKHARMFRLRLTHPRARDLLDQMITRDLSVTEIYRSKYGHDVPVKKLDLERLRVSILNALEQFAHQKGLLR